jgi:trimeric autotransporter adhesin
MPTSACLLQASFLVNWKGVAAMLDRRTLMKLGCMVALSFVSAAAVHADTLKQITSSSVQSANDSLAWSQKGADGTVLAASFTATTAMADSVTVGMGAANSIISVVCTATPCSWTGTGFTAGHSLLWSSDAGNGGSGPVTLTFSKSVSGAGALVQADLPGAFTGEIQVYNGTTLLATYTVASDTAGDPVYLGALDESGPNINKVVFSLTTCASLCTDFGLDTVNVNAATAAPAVTLTPTSFTFAATPVGLTTAAQTVTIKNSGTATLNLTSETITGTNATSFIKSATTCGTTLAALATCTVSVEFKPASAGALSAALSVADNAAGSPQAVTLTGTGTAPAVTLTPTSLTFASTTVGSTTAAQIVTIKNSGTATLNLASETITGTNATSFIKSATTCGATLAALAACTVSIEFKPTTTGALSASLSIADNAAGSPQAVTLTGTGTAASAPAVSLTPTSIAFPASIVSTTSGAQTVTLKNTGTATLTVSSIALGGTNPTSFVEIGTCGSSLAAGASCLLFVGFKPASAAAFSATLTVTDNAAGSPHSVTLTGTGTVAPTLKLSTTSITFPTTLHGTTSAASTITLTNGGTSTMTLSSIALAGTNPTDFVELNTCGATLAPAATCNVYAAFKPAAAGAFHATLTITDNGVASPQSVALAGTGN